MKRNKEIIVLEGAYILMLMVIFILPFFSVLEYSIIKNTTSQLGAQFAPNAWIMNVTFVSLGLSSIIAGWRFLDGLVFHRILLLIFGISLVLTAFFNHAPVNPDIQYNLMEDGWHSYFAYSTGLSFTIFAIATTFILENRTDRAMAALTGTAATILSILMSEASQFTGIWQRLIFIICFGWMICTFARAEKRIQ